MDGLFLLSLLIVAGVLLQVAAAWLRLVGSRRAAFGVVAVIPALVVAAAALTMRSPGPAAGQPHPRGDLTAILAPFAVAVVAIAVALIAKKRAGLLFWLVWILNLAPLALLIYLRFFFHISW